MSTTDFRESLEQGVSAHQAGRLDEALAHYRTALSLEPDDAEALSLSGLAMAQRGEVQDALPSLQRAVELEPSQIGLRMNLAEGLIQADEKERALQQLRIIVEAAPGNARALLRFRALNGQVLIERRDWPALSANAAAWIQVQPENPDAWRVAARAAFEQGHHVDACSAFARAMTLVQPTVVDHTAYAGLCLHALDFTAAAAALDRAEALDADYAPLLAKRALLLMYLGRFEESERYARRCLERDPQNVPAYTTLSQLKRGKLADADLAAVTQLMLETQVPLDYRISAAFVRAQILEARDDIDAAFAAYEQAHALAIERDGQEQRRYDRERVTRRAARITELSVAVPQQPTAAPRIQPRPIFIVGMPRSGTTLVESVLAAHSRVLAGGERPTMPQILRALLSLGDASALPDTQTLQQWTAAYFAGVPSRQGADHLTDKHPLNFEAVAWWRACFPRP
ncbi:MAG: tetratricopeptide repeat protein [Gammaproteobacteria bacterium]|nr:tetratricopeptide repeat protein [Gammaproteobacteria bacterium]